MSHIDMDAYFPSPDQGIASHMDKTTIPTLGRMGMSANHGMPARQRDRRSRQSRGSSITPSGRVVVHPRLAVGLASIRRRVRAPSRHQAAVVGPGGHRCSLPSRPAAASPWRVLLTGSLVGRGAEGRIDPELAPDMREPPRVCEPSIRHHRAQGGEAGIREE